jgi:hypothetical protein
MNEQISIFRNIIFHPSKAFKEIGKNPKKFLAGAILLGIIVIAKDIYHWRLVKPFYQSLILYPIYWITASLILYFFSWFFNRKLKFLNIFTCFGYTAVADIIMYLIGDIVIAQLFPLYYPVAGGTATLGYFFMQSPFNFILLWTITIVNIIWSFILYFFAIKEVNKFKTSKVFFVLILGGIIILLITTSINKILGF